MGRIGCEREQYFVDTACVWILWTLSSNFNYMWILILRANTPSYEDLVHFHLHGGGVGHLLKYTKNIGNQRRQVALYASYGSLPKTS